MSEGGSGSEWLLGRGLCAYTVFQCPPMPVGKRRAWLDMAVRRWAPFAQVRYHAEWQGPRAMVWAWSVESMRAPASPSDVLSDGLSDAGAEPPPRRAIPESLLVGAVVERGAQLLALEEGFEGRVWRDGVLAASNWWPEPPDLPDWNSFLRGAGQAAAEGPPEIERPGFSERSWAGALAGADWGELGQRYRVAALATAVGLAALLAVLPMAEIVKLHFAIAQTRARIVAQDETLQTMLSAREQAERDAAEVERLLALKPPVGQVELLATVVDLLPPGTRLLEWRMVNPSTLETSIGQANPDPRALVEAWQGSGLLREASVELGRARDEVTVRARVAPMAPVPEDGP